MGLASCRTGKDILPRAGRPAAERARDTYVALLSLGRRGSGLPAGPARARSPSPVAARRGAGARRPPQVTHLSHSAGGVEPHPVLNPGGLQGEPVRHVHAQHVPVASLSPGALRRRRDTSKIGVLGWRGEASGKRGNGLFLPESPPPRRFQDSPRLSPSSALVWLCPEPPLPLLPRGRGGRGPGAAAARRSLIGPKLAEQSGAG
jgi:hypothetical protein